MKERTKLKKDVCPKVFEDEWYRSNMQIIFRRYAPGFIIFVALFITASVALKKVNNLYFAITVLLFASLAGNVYLVGKPVQQYSSDTSAMFQCYGYDRIKKTANRVRRNMAVCICLNYFACLAVICPIYFEYDTGEYRNIFAAVILSVILLAVFSDCVLFLTVFRKQKVLFIFRYGFTEGKTEMHIKLKSGKEILYQRDFDLSDDGADLIIVRQDNYFETYDSDDIAALTIKNDNDHKVVYKYINSNWVIQ